MLGEKRGQPHRAWLEFSVEGTTGDLTQEGQLLSLCHQFPSALPSAHPKFCVTDFGLPVTMVTPLAWPSHPASAWPPADFQQVLTE